MADTDTRPADASGKEQGKAPSDKQVADVGNPTPASLQELAKDLPERDPVQKAHKQALLAENAQDEARAQAKVVAESRDSIDTPSGFALSKVAGIGNDAERGEEYARLKSAKRSGLVPAEDL